MERTLPAVRHPMVAAARQLPTAVAARPLPRRAGQEQLHWPGPAPPAGGLQPLQGPGSGPHRVRLPQGGRAVQTR